MYEAFPHALFALANPTQEAGNRLRHHAGKVHDTIYDLEWKGLGKLAAEGRADNELAQDRRIADGYTALATAYSQGGSRMQPLIWALKADGRGLESDDFDIDEDWNVTDKWNYAKGKEALVVIGVSEEAAEQIMNEVKAKRTEEARTETVKLQGQADQLGQTDRDTADAINKAKADIDAAAPPVAGLSGGDLAAKDFKAVEDGTATPEQKARVRAAMSSWTPEQLDALSQGKPATMPQGQYDYLRSLMHGMDGMSASEVNESMKKLGLQGEMGTALRMLGNPNLQTGTGDHGGMATLPQGIQDLLTSQPPNKLQVGFTDRMNQFNALTDMLDRGDSRSLSGSDVDRALLNQASKIAAPVDLSKPWNPLDAGTPDELNRAGGMGDPNLQNSTLNRMLISASGDHQAVTDFLKGANDPQASGAMNAATNGHFDGNKAFVDLVTHRFGEGQDGIQKVFGWMDDSARAPGFEGRNAAISASALGHLLSTNGDLLAARVPGDDGHYDTLGQVNKGLVQTMTGSLAPFLGNLVGMPTEGINNASFQPFANTEQLAKMLQVLDSDPASAEAINQTVAAWENHFAHEYGEHPPGQLGDPAFARAAGQLNQAMTEANHEQLNALRANENWDALRSYNDKAAYFDDAKSILGEVAGKLPGAGPALDILGNHMKESIIGYPPGTDPGKMSDSEWTRMLNDTDMKFNNLTDSRVVEYSTAQGYLETNREIAERFRGVMIHGVPVDFVDAKGQLVWEKVQANAQDFERIYNSLQIGNEWSEGYQNGMHDKAIGTSGLTAPVSPGEAPR
ncbi:hypothetical protein FZI91_12435 [Mycobacterium sp. CBMA271]|uniref:TPR repeat region-containing protein n=1 Tax=unclassified Mycobacteroides TaxID=2618759 RepID=UPI0012DF5AB3|nr:MULTISPECIES: hypothetical protein [unclassified Mycobacteroides]MUM16000.1 hypothetical protein [Mycobacteroides sp. CBMA 326]MUM22501.1 hypothetical protein [Mycobacteroides sp. CBMA 271]